MASVAGEALRAARYLGGVAAFLRRPGTLAEAHRVLRLRLERREATFLALVRRVVYERRFGPYPELLRHAGCEYGDLVQLVERDGLEGALRALFRAGVYLSVDELKGKRPVTRGGTAIRVHRAALRNPCSTVPSPLDGAGGVTRPRAVPTYLAMLRDHAASGHLALEAHGGLRWRIGTWWMGAIEGVVLVLARHWGQGTGSRRFFWGLDLRHGPGAAPRNRWGTRAVQLAGRLGGSALPKPQHVPLEQPLPVAQWLAGVLGAGDTPALYTIPSAAVRLAEAADSAGLDLSGARLWISSEPVTARRVAALRRVGAEAIPLYAARETGPIADGCLAPEGPDDCHVYHDLHALIQAGAAGEAVGLPPRALLVTSLQPSAPLILLNASLGDEAVLARRACGCPLEALGWATHVRDVRSFEKLKAGGAMLVERDVIRILEDALPARFGGGPTDYQLVESESASGEPRLSLLVHPRLGALDAGTVRETMLTAMADVDADGRRMADAWRRAGWLEVVRRPPAVTGTGKLLHLHRDDAPSVGAAPVL